MEAYTARTRDLRRRLAVALLTPIAMLLAMGALLAVQIEGLIAEAAWVDHADEVIATASNLEKELIDKETGLRGYLLGADRIFLEPYEVAQPTQAMAELRRLVADNAGQRARIGTLEGEYAHWLRAVAEPALADPAAARTPEMLREGKRQMDAIRTTLEHFDNVELDLRSERAKASAASLARGRAAFVVLFLVAAATLALVSRRQLASIALVYEEVLVRDRAAREAAQSEQWIREGQAKLGRILLGEQPYEQLGHNVLAMLADHMRADVGAFFTVESGACERLALFGLDAAAAGPATFGVGDGVVGRVSKDAALLHMREVPADFLRVRSGTGARAPVEVVVVPAVHAGATRAVVELGFLRPVDEPSLSLLSRIGEPIALAVRSEQYQRKLRELLLESQRQGEALQAQQEELRVANEELEQQSVALLEAHRNVEQRQQEIEETNARLEENAHELMQSREAFKHKAHEADRASTYKSEFLANMSHELRTPLNSTLILARLLADNKHGNLTEEQVRFASTIYTAGNDLLSLINDILDLSKIEAGRVEVRSTRTSIAQTKSALARTFEPVARQKHVELSIVTDGGAPDDLETDAQRLEQILRNLLSNALKFTESGSVSLRISSGYGTSVVFEVKDTGVGIAPDQQQVIFEPFRQADGTTNRKFGGTGLGLSISRDLATVLGGTLDVESELGKGSTFRLTLPRVYVPVERSQERSSTLPESPRLLPARAPHPAYTPAFSDDRAALDANRRLLLVIEDDLAFARILYDLARERNLQCVVAHDADSGLALAVQHLPSAVVLDMNLPDHTGLYVLDRLKRNPLTRHLPVHVMSVAEHAQEALSMGAVGYLHKPVEREALVEAFSQIEARISRRMRRLLIVEDDAVHRDSLSSLLAASEVEVVAVGTMALALTELKASTFDCIVTDLGLPDRSGFDLLEQLATRGESSPPPVIVYTGRKLSQAEEQQLRRHSSSIIVKGARSIERLVDEVTLFLHQVESQLPSSQRKLLREARDREAIFDGKTVLLVEDDIRNVFALSKVLEPKGANVVIARNGREALDALERAPVDLVLMDIMMPEMDGLEATRAVRKRPEWAKLPIIALTAKAMPDDREACLRAGVNDYVSKPIDLEMLLSLMRVWMSR